MAISRLMGMLGEDRNGRYLELSKQQKNIPTFHDTMTLLVLHTRRRKDSTNHVDR